MARLEASLCPKTGAWAKLRSGGSVATAAWDFARNCNGSALYVLGLDLSYPTLRSHCPGTRPQRRIFAQSHRLRPAEQINWQSTICAGTQLIENWNGGQTRSDKRMNIYRNWLEESLKNTAARKNWPNYVLGGCGGNAAKIAGMELQSLNEALKLPPRRNEIEPRIHSILERTTQAKTVQNETAVHDAQCRKLGKELAKIQAEVQDIYNWSAELPALLCDAAQQHERESKISRSPSRKILGFLFTETLAQIAGRSPEQSTNTETRTSDAKAVQGQIERVLVYHQFFLSSKFHIYWLAMAQKQLGK